jgi:hypothetical protein
MKLGKYLHYKKHEVEVLGIALHSETQEELVVYKKLKADKGFKKGQLWARPKKMFVEKVLVDGKKVSRFKYIGK